MVFCFRKYKSSKSLKTGAPDPCALEHNRTQQNTTEHTTTQQNTTGRNRTQQNATEQNTTEHNMTQQNKTWRSRTLANISWIICECKINCSADEEEVIMAMVQFHWEQDLRLEWNSKRYGIPDGHTRIDERRLKESPDMSARISEIRELAEGRAWSKWRSDV